MRFSFILHLIISGTSTSCADVTHGQEQAQSLMRSLEARMASIGPQAVNEESLVGYNTNFRASQDGTADSLFRDKYLVALHKRGNTCATGDCLNDPSVQGSDDIWNLPSSS